MPEVTGKTRICGIIGDPVEHTMSPVMQNAAFAHLKLDYCYLPFRVTAGDLKQAIDGIRALHFAGLNVTIPHKIAVLDYLDEIDVTAGEIGAVNTLVLKNGRLTGYNTDAGGFIRAMLHNDVEPGGKQVVVAGAGGASRAICFALAQHGATVTILNRGSGLDRAYQLARKLNDNYPGKARAMELVHENLKSSLNKADILVNATSAGMAPNVGETIVQQHLLRPGLVVFDAVYNPEQTRLLREASEAGARTISGLDMLVWQGAMAFEHWTGVPAPVEIMKAAAIKVPGG